MGKLGLPRHRYTVATLCWFYVVISLLLQIFCIFTTFYGSVFVTSTINLLIGCLGLYSLYKEHEILMKSYGIITAILVVLQVLEIIGLIMLSQFRKVFLNAFLKELMEKYYETAEDRDIMDSIQRGLQCCGRQSYYDWTIQPYSCCKDADCLAYHTDGCVDALTPIVSYIFLAVGLVCVVSIIVHIYAVVSAFNLARIYRRIPILPNIKHSFTNL